MVPLPLEKLLASFPLRIRRIPNLEPTRLLFDVRIKLALCNDALKIIVTGNTEQALSIAFDVIAVQNAFATGWKNRAQLLFAFDQRPVSKVLPVTPKQIERYESRLAASVKQITELRLARIVQTHDLAI